MDFPADEVSKCVFVTQVYTVRHFFVTVFRCFCPCPSFMRTFVGTQQDSQHIGKQRVQGLNIQCVKTLSIYFVPVLVKSMRF